MRNMPNLIDKVNHILRCPSCGNALNIDRNTLYCTECNQWFPYSNAIIHFIADENDRPAIPKRLSEWMYGKNSSFTVGRRRRYAIEQYKQDKTIRGYVEFSHVTSGIIVDLASGPSGGYVHNILESIGPNTVLIITDACQWVIDKYSEYYGRRYSGRFGCIDVDLDKKLPFADGSIDVFTGVLLCNVGNYKGLLQEVSRCLKRDGKAVFHEVFYSEQSDSFRMLSNEDAVYVSDKVLCGFCEDIGLNTIKVVECWKGIGKVNPQDSMPINNNDEWYRKNIYLVKR